MKELEKFLEQIVQSMSDKDFEDIKEENEEMKKIQEELNFYKIIIICKQAQDRLDDIKEQEDLEKTESRGFDLIQEYIKNRGL